MRFLILLINVVTDLQNTATGTQFVKTSQFTVTWYSSDGIYEQDYSITRDNAADMPWIDVNLLEIAH